MMLSTIAILHGRAPAFQAAPVLIILGLITAIIWLYMDYLTRVAETLAWTKLVAADTRAQEIR